MLAPRRPPPPGRRPAGASPPKPAPPTLPWRRARPPRAAPGDAGAPAKQSPQPPPHIVRPAREEDWWGVASVHVEAFFPDAGAFTPLLRFDRVLGLQTGYANAAASDRAAAVRGPFLCLVATTGEEEGMGEVAAAGAPPPPPRAYPRPAWPAAWLPPAAWGAFGDAAATAGPVRGAVVVDVQGGHVPPRLVRARGTRRAVQRAGLAYVSNLAVAPAARRAGLGSALLAAAEAQAWAWGCHALALHVDARNAAAADLYRRAGYRPATRGAPPPPGSSGLGGLLGPSGQPLALMLKVRPRGVERSGAGCGELS